LIYLLVAFSWRGSLNRSLAGHLSRHLAELRDFRDVSVEDLLEVLGLNFNSLIDRSRTQQSLGALTTETPFPKLKQPQISQLSLVDLNASGFLREENDNRSEANSESTQGGYSDWGNEPSHHWGPTLAGQLRLPGR
jgi:hypothetical protein